MKLMHMEIDGRTEWKEFGECYRITEIGVTLCYIWGVFMEGSIFFIGEKMRNQEWRITRRPNFYDAVLLTQQSNQTAEENSSYQSIPLGSANIAFNLYEHNIYFTYHLQTLQIEIDSTEPSEEDIFDVFNSLLLKEGNMVSYLVLIPKGKTSPVHKKKTRILAEAKKLELPNSK